MDFGTIMEVLEDNIIEEFANAENFDFSLVSEYIKDSQTEYDFLVLKLQEEIIRKNFFAYLDEEIKKEFEDKIKDVDLSKPITFSGADDMALVLKTGVKLQDEDLNVYSYNKSLLNPYRVDTDDTPIDYDWYKCDENHKFTILVK